jgi:hypothetical protein
MIVIARNDERVAVHYLKRSEGSDLAPLGYVEHDYDANEIAELNSFASHGLNLQSPDSCAGSGMFFFIPLKRNNRSFLSALSQTSIYKARLRRKNLRHFAGKLF